MDTLEGVIETVGMEAVKDRNIIESANNTTVGAPAPASISRDPALGTHLEPKAPPSSRRLHSV